MDSYAQLRDAVMGAQNIQAPASTLGASSAPELANMYRSSFQLPLSNAGTQAQAANTKVTVANQEATRKAKEDLSDPDKYQKIKKADGGFEFIAPDGTKISAYDYANILGKKPADVLKDSENPIDIGYQQDYKNLQDYMNAWVNGDKEAVSAFQNENPSLKKIKDVKELVDYFKTAYPTVYNWSGPAGVKAGKTIIPNKKVAANNALTSGNGIAE